MARAHPAGMALFATAIGRCGIAWAGECVRATALPEPDEGRMAARLSARAVDAEVTEPPVEIVRAIEGITALLDGAKLDLAFIDCDFSGVEPFASEVYVHTRAIPPGETLRYGDIASQMGDLALARAVGHALGRNPFPIVVPCHRVVGAGGRLTGFSASGGVATKLRMLAIEGAAVAPAPTLFDDLPLAVKPGRR